MTLVDQLMRASSFPDVGLRVLDRDGSETWLPWPEVVARAQAAAAWLQALGVRYGDRVALVYPTVPALFDALFGILLAGAVPVPLYPPVRLGRFDEYRERTVQMLRSVDARLVLAAPRVRLVIGDIIRQARPPLGCRSLENGARPHLDGDLGPRFSTVQPDDLALVQFSSGTTRAPKPVALTHRAVIAQATILNLFWPDTTDVRHSGVSWLPLYHDMGLIGCVFTALERPGTLTLIPPELFVNRPAAWLQAISRYRATISPAPNFAYNLAVHRIRDEELEGVDLSCWQVALCGAETVVPDVMRAFANRFSKWGFRAEALTPVYGLSEASLAVTFSPPLAPLLIRRFDRQALAVDGIAREAEAGRELVSVGRAVPGFEVRIVDDTRAMLPDGRVGSVECRGPSLMKEYFGHAQATADALRDGWLVTGDLGFLLDGHLFLTGRRKDVLIVRGANHAPEELERVAQQVDGVRPGCAVATSWLPEGADGEQVLVFVETRRGVPSSSTPAIASACEHAVLASTGLAARVVVLAPGTLPRTSSGKLRRRDALAQYLAGTLDPPDGATTLRMAVEAGRSALAYLRMRLEE
jgi:acyl-CoA synthetase (AMP-forming)/AMP-acid ligase II